MGSLPLLDITDAAAVDTGALTASLGLAFRSSAVHPEVGWLDPAIPLLFFIFLKLDLTGGLRTSLLLQPPELLKPALWHPAYCQYCFQ